MRLEDVFEAKYAKPPVKHEEPKIPEHLRTKHGLNVFLREWKEKLRSELWAHWMTNYYEDVESFYEYVRGYLPGKIRDIVQKDVPSQFDELFDNAFDEVFEEMQSDLEEEIASRDEEE